MIFWYKGTEFNENSHYYYNHIGAAWIQATSS